MKIQTVFAAALLGLAGCKKDLNQQHLAAPPTLAAAQALVPSQNEIRVMSFNIRNSVAGDPFSQDERKGYIMQTIQNYNPDIFGIQELADNAMESYFNTQMAAAGYGVYNAGAANGSPKSIWYKTTRFTLTTAGSFTMKTPDYRSGKWVVLQDKLTTANSYFVVNSHWSTEGTSQRSMDADSILLAIKSNNTQDLPVICLGDFNAQPGTAEITKIKDADGLNMFDALLDADGDLTFHGWDATGDSKIDYILSTRNLAVKAPSVVTTSYTVNGTTLWPSDHWPVVASYIPAILGDGTTDGSGKSASAATIYSFGDINGDGKQDRIYWNRTYDNGNPRVYLSNGNGTFSSSVVAHTAGASTLASTKYYYADINGDGKDDEIVWDPTLNSGRTRVFLATTNGNFSSTAIENPEGASAAASTIFNFADVNGDGKADKIYWNYTYDGGHTRVYLATSGGSFSGTVVSGTEGASTISGTAYYYADINGDGKKDKVLWHPTLNSGKAMVYLSDGDGTFTASSSYSNSGAYSESTATTFYFADINGDGKADKIYWKPTGNYGALKIYLAGTAGEFTAPIFSLRGTSRSADTRFYFEDINGDNKADQVRWNYGENDGALRNYLSQ